MLARAHVCDLYPEDRHPPDRILYTWFPGGGVGPTEVEVRFVPEGQATMVMVEHRVGDSDFGAEWPTRAKAFASAWDAVLRAFSEFAGR